MEVELNTLDADSRLGFLSYISFEETYSADVLLLVSALWTMTSGHHHLAVENGASNDTYCHYTGMCGGSMGCI
jgi:hypothetical protein